MFRCHIFNLTSVNGHPDPTIDASTKQSAVREGKPALIVGWDWDFAEEKPQEKEDKLSQMHVKTIYGKKHQQERHKFIWSYTQLREHNVSILSFS